jgi:hypothetical protein
MTLQAAKGMRRELAGSWATIAPAFVPTPGSRPGGMYWRTWRSLCVAPTSARTIRIEPYGTGSIG